MTNDSTFIYKRLTDYMLYGLIPDFNSTKWRTKKTKMTKTNIDQILKPYYKKMEDKFGAPLNYAVHIKTGHLYYIEGLCLNCTNKEDNHVMVMYQNTNGDKFVREIEEFMTKFKEYKND